MSYTARHDVGNEKVKISSSYALTLLSGLICLEAFLHFFGVKQLGGEVTSILTLIIGLAIGLFPLLTRYQYRIDSDEKGIPSYVQGIIFLLICLLVFHYAGDAFSKVIIDYQQADMLPVIEVMNERFLLGEDPYTPIQEIWEGTQPIYLPALWMPYMISELIAIDMRWIGITFILIGLLLFFCISSRKTNTAVQAVTIYTPILLTILLLVSYDVRAITLTQEGVVIGYYMLLGFSLCRGNWLLVGVAAGLCIMSRYMILPWVGILFITLCLQKSRKEVGAFVIGLSVLPLILILLSGVWPNLGTIVGLSDHYLNAVISLPQKYAYTIEQSTGMARFFFPSSMEKLSSTMLAGAVLIPAIGFVVFIKKKNALPLHLYALCLLKLSMVWILCFITIPYEYLFLTSIFLSSFLLFVIPRRT